MIQLWVFILACIIFTGILIWERMQYRQLEDNLESAEFFLDLYMKEYGTIKGMVVVEEAKDADKK